MKTYLLDSFNRYKRFSEKLDAKTLLSNKTWHVFNDTGEKEIYIFEEDGSLIISVNGIVTEASWKFITSNQTIIIKTTNQKLMLQPSFVDGNIFSLQLDGTNQYTFLIDDNNVASSGFKTLNDIKNYFIHKEKKVIEHKEKKRLKKHQEEDLIEKERIKRQKEIEKEKRRQEENERLIRKQNEIRAKNIAVLNSTVRKELHKDVDYQKIKVEVNRRYRLSRISRYIFVVIFLLGFILTLMGKIPPFIFLISLIPSIWLIFYSQKLLAKSDSYLNYYENHFRNKIAKKLNIMIN